MVDADRREGERLSREGKKSGILHGFRRRELCKDNEKGWACRLGHTPDVYKQMCLT